ncbi:rod shape-determining protein RodA [Pseudoalteromonas sp. MMG013]|uniref:Peptidoglycan glycosyltransferase MrdB n=1 Tax=Pseudoalteromonas aurantia 208 TaxID=1314867 RepID=A0ABR9E897_9GAMM|nr:MULTISPECIES: rod shape-determining protein RodA [Pseudoalteromonas]MBE0367214.1 rod shape determining protein RodA [Pseudoalteromonas aurantia 208]MBQ4845747.1 rod shape-determining protein RodA [Pseudoalteromonas sp. MMG005]MBQ4851210.1 rod shape-determining protein RodA [Pseudoalteromonas sp. MMG012]MBQ4861695.1 rod shape-determining protein RodA [Pseudoalteromonas sp. MMG013]
MIPLNYKRTFWQKVHIDLPLLFALIIMMLGSLTVVYSASGQDINMMTRHATRMASAVIALLFMAQLSPNTLKRIVIPMYIVGLGMLVAVLFVGVSSKGAQRWLDVGITRFQPAEIMKIAVPMMVAWYIGQHRLPPSILNLFIGFTIVMVPTILIKEQPDLGTSILIASSGIFVLFLSGLSWRLIGFAALLMGPAGFAFWSYGMHAYQKQRVLTLFNPESDPLGAGYHIIQSKIAIGSGGIEGKGWLHGTQSQLEFLPERHTDFIFSVLSEEFGLLGVILLLSVYLFIIGRGLYIAVNAQDAFSKLLAGALTMTFFVYIFVNIGMVSGLLPVVGVPLPLISYGGTSMVTLMAGFGIIMAIATDKRMLLKS